MQCWSAEHVNGQAGHLGRTSALVMAAAAFLAELAADLRSAASSNENETSPKPPIAA